MNGHERQEPMVFMTFMGVHGCSWAFMGLHGDRGFTDVAGKLTTETVYNLDLVN